MVWLRENSLPGKCALIIGCAPSLDAISDHDLKRLWGTDFVKFGLNWTPLADKIHRNGLRFDCVVFRDDVPAERAEAHEELSKMADAGEFHFVRIGNQADAGRYHQKLESRLFPQTAGIGGNVVGLAYWAGIRKMIFLGVDLFGSYCKWAAEYVDKTKDLERRYSHDDECEVVADDAGSWKRLLDSFADCRFGCLNPRSLLIGAGARSLS